MVLGCGNSCVKLVLFATNLVIVVLSGIILTICLLMNLSPHFLTEFQRLGDNAGVGLDFSTYTAALYVLAGLAAIVLAIGLLGCIGACCESQCVMILYMLTMSILLLLQIALLIYIAVKKGHVETDIKTLLDHVKDPQAFKPIQDEWHCCGVDGTPLLHGGACTKEETDNGGCYDAIRHWVDKAAITAILVAILLGIVQCISIVFACVLIGAMRRSTY